ncbi:MAG: PorT family protein [Prevotella sp.]|nr:PorT family protein [Prevotella sp.]
MKKLMMIAALMVATLSANAQDMFIKPMVGGTLSTLRGSDVEGNKMRLGLAAGAEFGYMFTEQFGATGGLLVSMQGSNFKDTDYTKDVSTTLTYLNVPMLANYYIFPGFAVKAGVQFGFLLSAKHKASERLLEGSWHDYEQSGTDGMKKLDFSIPLGISYEFSDFVIDARYNLGLTKINNSDYASKAYNSVIMLTLGYKIPL